MNEPARRNSDLTVDLDRASRCDKHNLYYNQKKGGCWKCAQEAPVPATAFVDQTSIAGPVRPVVARQEESRRQEEQRPSDAVALVWDRFLQTTKFDAPAAAEILKVCLDLAAFLMEKNSAYGNSALEPLRVISKADAAEQIRIRIDDKLSRLFRGQAGGEDALQDLVGYWVLLKVLEARTKGNGHA